MNCDKNLKVIGNLVLHLGFFLSIVVYLISGIIYVFKDYDISIKCDVFDHSILGIINLLFFFISGIIKFYEFKSEYIRLPLINHILFFIGNFVLFITGITGLIIVEDCEIYKQNLWYFNMTSVIINFIFLIVIIYYTITKIGCFIKNIENLFVYRKQEKIKNNNKESVGDSSVVDSSVGGNNKLTITEI